MPNKPTTVPTLDTNQTNRTAPAASKISDGYVLNDTFPAANANYLHGWAGDWISWLDATFGDGANAASLDIALGGGTNMLTVEGRATIEGRLFANEDVVASGQISASERVVASGGSTARHAVSASKDTSSNSNDINQCYYASFTLDETIGSSFPQACHWSEVLHELATGETAAEVRNVWASLICDGTPGNITDYTAFYSSISLSPSGVGDTTNVYGLYQGGTVNSDITGVMVGAYVSNPAGTGTIAALYGVDIEDLTRGTTNYGVRIRGADPGYSLYVDGDQSYFGGEVEIDAGLILGEPSDTVLGESPVTVRAYNEGAAVSQYDIVIVANPTSANRLGFETTNTAGSNDVMGVATEAISAGAYGRIAVFGLYKCNHAGGIVSQQHVVTSTTTGKATDTSAPGAHESKGLWLETNASTGTSWCLLR